MKGFPANGFLAKYRKKFDNRKQEMLLEQGDLKPGGEPRATKATKAM